MNTPKPKQRSGDGKPKQFGRIAVIVAVLALLAALAGFILQRSYYPMDGEVRILSKEKGRGFTLTVEQGFREGQKAGRFLIDTPKSVSKGTVLIDTLQLIGYDENKGEKWRWRERHGS